MSKPKFTPGPWEISDEGTHILTEAKNGAMYQLADLSDGCFNREANARLIAQAPAMYEALKRALMFLPDELGRDGYSDRVKIERILAAVEGK